MTAYFLAFVTLPRFVISSCPSSMFNWWFGVKAVWIDYCKLHSLGFNPNKAQLVTWYNRSREDFDISSHPARYQDVSIVSNGVVKDVWDSTVVIAHGKRMEVLFKKTNFVIFSIPFRICRSIHFPSSTVKYSQAVSKSSFRILHMPPNREASSRLLSRHLSPLRSRQNHAETTQLCSSTPAMSRPNPASLETWTRILQNHARALEARRANSLQHCPRTRWIDVWTIVRTAGIAGAAATIAHPGGHSGIAACCRGGIGAVCGVDAGCRRWIRVGVEGTGGG
jgi:hypothetical protein